MNLDPPWASSPRQSSASHDSVAKLLEGYAALNMMRPWQVDCPTRQPTSPSFCIRRDHSSLLSENILHSPATFMFSLPCMALQSPVREGRIALTVNSARGLPKQTDELAKRLGVLPGSGAHPPPWPRVSDTMPSVPSPDSLTQATIAPCPHVDCKPPRFAGVGVRRRPQPQGSALQGEDPPSFAPACGHPPNLLPSCAADPSDLRTLIFRSSALALLPDRSPGGRSSAQSRPRWTRRAPSS